jgi:hypothetical protein
MSGRNEKGEFVKIFSHLIDAELNRTKVSNPLDTKSGRALSLAFSRGPVSNTRDTCSDSERVLLVCSTGRYRRGLAAQPPVETPRRGVSTTAGPRRRGEVYGTQREPAMSLSQGGHDAGFGHSGASGNPADRRLCSALLALRLDIQPIEPVPLDLVVQRGATDPEQLCRARTHPFRLL